MRYFLLALLFSSIHATQVKIIETNEASAEQVIFIMGPSCSGKSTIAKALIEKLDNNWSLIEYDALEDLLGRKVSGEEIFIKMMHAANEPLACKKNVVIDTNTFYGDHCILLKTKIRIFSNFCFDTLIAIFFFVYHLNSL